MHCGRSVFARQCCPILCVIAFVSCAALCAVAQKNGSESATKQSTPPAISSAPPSADPAASKSSAGPTSAKPGPVPAESITKQDSSLLRLGPGDLVELSVYNVPELTTKARISSSGDVYLPLIDYVHLADLTVEEAQTLLEKRLADGGFVRNPHVTIFLDESASQGVTMLGEVSKPGIYAVIGDRKLYDVLSQAGGFSPGAGRKVSIIRHDQPQPITLNLPKNLADDMQDNIQIQAAENLPSVPAFKC